MGFQGAKTDTLLFIYKDTNTVMYILIYVDDTILTGSSDMHIQKLIAAFKSEFANKDLGDLHFFLGIEAKHSPQGLFLSQQKYILELLKKTSMVGAKPISTPMATSPTLTAHSGFSFHDPSLYRSIVGALQYATMTRPDISFAVNKVCQYMHNPKNIHWAAVKRILRYLKQTFDHRLSLTPCMEMDISAYSDADWAGFPDDRQSTSGYAIFLGKNLVSWSSKKQNVVSRSSTEAEYRAIANATAEVTWIKFLLQELGIKSS
ncbi:uncharacterized mitochondrial protein AtMg00810-like [Nymphaea colorata]|uniref:uncharacterized mitochondrial protein AtMg00810-like n=1 Tax=Nymphaea colorata TaxID=210225 RepID=UPI00129E991A|nr:uncharacterized mitochondrial protein AtMg00810-like [Nymphaea colorata]